MNGASDDSRRPHIGEHRSDAHSVDLARSKEQGRGRQAGSPEQIPLRGWKDILWRVLWSVSEHRILSTSGGVAFFTLLAVFPGIAALVSLYGLFADATTAREHLTLLAGILPFGILQLVADQILMVVKQGSDTLGTAFIVGLFVALISANSGIAALFDALNVVYNEREKRSFIRFYVSTFLVTMAGISVVILVFIGVVALPILLRIVGLSNITEMTIVILRWPILFVTVGLSLAAVYRYGPSRRDAQWRWVVLGSIVASLLWIVASMLFSWYVVTFDSYNKVYGSLGAVVGFMVWLWISAVIVLFGGELNAEMEHQTSRDTTQGRSRALGSRGAMVADHVGEAQD